jgi:predicted Zn-dependent peptidase
MNNKVDLLEIKKNFKLLNVKDKNALSFTIGFTFGIGSRNEQGFPVGISHFLEHAIFRGSETMNAREISLAFESKGAYVNAYTTKDSICFYAKALNNHFEDILDLLIEIIYKPNFNKDELEKEKKVIIEEINATKDDYEDSIFDEADELVFAGSSLQEPITGRANSVRKVTIAQLKQYHFKMLNDSNVVISLVSNFKTNDLLKKINEKLSSYLTDRKSNNDLFRKKELSILEKFKKKKIDSYQSHLMIAMLTFGFNDKRYYPLLLLNNILGEGMSSYMYQSLRENLGLTYNVYSMNTSYTDTGALYIYTGLDKVAIEDAWAEISKILKSLANKGVTESELQSSKEQIKSSLIFEAESQSFLMQYYSKQILFNKEIESLQDVLNKIDTIKLKEVNQVAKAIFNEENFIRLDYLQKK